MNNVILFHIVSIQNLCPCSKLQGISKFNIDTSVSKTIIYDIGAVDGLNANATATYTGCSSEQKKQCMTNLAAYDRTNEGCPYIMQIDSANICPNPKFYPADINISPKPSWLVGQSKFTTEKLSSDYPNYYKAAGSPSGSELASAKYGDAVYKKAYHIWWSTNPVAQGWLRYQQKNKAGLCDAYGWAYDEKRWVPSECDPNKDKCFEDDTGNPPDNKDIKALIQCPYIPNSYLNIDILYVM